jgi:hypothetical protein
MPLRANNEPEPEPKPDPQPEPKPEPKPDPKPTPDPKPDPKPEPKPEEKSLPETLGFPKPTNVNSTNVANAVQVLAFGTVLDQDAKPLSGAAVMFHIVHVSAEGAPKYESNSGGSTNKEGKFSVNFKFAPSDGSEPTVVVSASKNGYCWATVVAPNPEAAIELRLIAISTETAIEGDVVDTEGVAAAGRKVYAEGKLQMLSPDSLFALAPAVQEVLAANSSKPWASEANTDEFGHFIMKRLPPGTYKVWAGEKALPEGQQPTEIEVYEGRSNLVPGSLTVPAAPKPDESNQPDD